MANRRGPMSAGERDRLITLEELTDGVGSSGAPVETWTTLVSNMPASRMDLSGREAYRSGQLSAAIDTRWEINYRADMDPELIDVPKKRRVLAGGRYFDIVAASQIGRRAGIELLTLASSRVP